MIGSRRLFILGLPLLMLLGSRASARFRLIEVRTPAPEAIDRMRASGAYEVLEIEGERATLVEDEELLAGFGEDQRRRVQLLRGAYRILHQDLDELFAPFRERGSEGAYHSFPEVQEEVAALAAAHPDRVSVEEIGRSIEDRPLLAVRVSRRDGVERPRAVFMGMIHAREWISTEMAMAFLNRIVDPGDDAELAAVVDDLDIYVVPVLNPDGLAYSQNHYRWWRGNRRVNSDGSIGVDLNRNYTVGWGIGSSSVPGSQTYKGPSPMSEPETQAFDGLVARVRPTLTMTWHAYGRMILLPFGYRATEPARWDLYQEITPAMRVASGYRMGPIHQLIRVTGGSTDDHFLVEHGAFVATLELGTSFIPRESEIQPTLAEALPAALLWLKATQRLAGIDPREPASTREVRFRGLHSEN